MIWIQTMFRTSYDLRSDVLEEREYVEISSRHNLLEHRVDHDIAASPDDRFDDFYPNCQQWWWWGGWQFAEALSGTRFSSQSWASFWYIDYDEDDHDADTNNNDDGDDKEDW